MNKIIRSNTKSPEIKQTTKSTDPTREIKISKKEKKGNPILPWKEYNRR